MCVREREREQGGTGHSSHLTPRIPPHPSHLSGDCVGDLLGAPHAVPGHEEHSAVRRHVQGICIILCCTRVYIRARAYVTHMLCGVCRPDDM